MRLLTKSTYNRQFKTYRDFGKFAEVCRMMVIRSVSEGSLYEFGI